MLQNQEYNQIIKEEQMGGFNQFTYKNTTIYVLGASCANLPSINYLNTLKYIQPDMLLINIKPDEHINNFTFQLTNPKTGAFSNRKYLEQISIENKNFHLSNMKNEKQIY